MNNTGDVVYYLGANDSTKKEDGTSAVLNGNDGQVMVEVPEHYRKTTLNAAQGYMDIEISLFPFGGAFLVPRYLVSAYEAALDRDNNILSSVVNTTTRYRGGNNTAEWDATYRSLLGLPATSISHRLPHPTERIVELVGVATTGICTATSFGSLPLSMQHSIRRKPLTKTSPQRLTTKAVLSRSFQLPKLEHLQLHQPVHSLRIHQLPRKQDWCQDLPLTAEAEAYGSAHSESVPSYRGIENPFGHIWKWADGLLCKGDGTKQDFYVSRVRGQVRKCSQRFLCKGRLGCRCSRLRKGNHRQCSVNGAGASQPW